MKKIFFFSTILFIFIILIIILIQNNEITNKDFLKHKINSKRNSPAYDKPMEAIKFWYEQRAFPLGYIPENWREKALKHIEEHNIISTSNVTGLTWTSLGPSNIAGRVRSIVIDHSNPSIIYAGSVSGGVWKSTNEGQNWFPLKDKMDNLAVCALAMDPANSNIIYAGTGEGFFNIDAIRGAGIFKTTDYGVTWTRLESTNNSNFYYVNDIEIDKNTGRIYAATWTGLYFSTNFGASWSLVNGGISGNVHCMDIEISTTNPSVIFASYGHFSQSRIFKSTNGGLSFTEIHSLTNQGRAEIAINKSNPKIVYISFHDLNTNEVTKFQKSTNGGNSFFDITVPGPSLTFNSYTGPQAWYNNILQVHPENENIVFAGGVDLFKSTDGGQNWSQITNWYQHYLYPYVHADFHAIVFHPTNSNIIYVGTDGGVFRTSNGGLTWNEKPTGMTTIQFYYGSTHPSQNIYYGGTQDNGVVKNIFGTNWQDIFGGDGGATEVDFNNPNIVYTEYVNLAIFKSTNSGQSWTKIMNGIPSGSGTYDGTTDRVLFIAPIKMDPNNPLNLVAGTYRVFRTTNGGNSWSAISGDLTGDGTGSIGAKISALAIAKNNSNVIYAGCTNGRVLITTNAGRNWENISSGLPTLYVRDIEISNSSPGTVFVAFSGYTSGAKIYKTTNYGSSWTNISSNLPNIPVNCIVINPQNASHILIGTDLGVFETTNSGISWFQTDPSLPNVAVFDMTYKNSNNTIYAWTHGRGLWRASLPTSVKDEKNEIVKEFKLYQNFPNPFNSETTIRYSIPSTLFSKGYPKVNVKIKLYDLQGKELKTLVDEDVSSGKFEKKIKLEDLTSGIYLYRITAGEYSETKKMILLK
ncbi:MAG: T9SS type A sorting domain-containing protein [Ignavibacteria bacterium]|jgi:photosystem II stability/assembly factor-like uncharacterized protein|nr:T9SS type A sorting domain-containing protein [Ignavibacteria bacterium]MDH7526681.1 T9SS type A sorting domain-containing protein [Ignavibacteria bacterium]